MKMHNQAYDLFWVYLKVRQEKILLLSEYYYPRNDEYLLEISLVFSLPNPKKVIEEMYENLFPEILVHKFNL